MLKLRKNIRDFLTANVRPFLLEKWIERIERAATDRTANYWRFDTHETVTGVEFSLTVAPIDFEEVEELKPYTWYPKEKWDGNPKGLILIGLDSRTNALGISKDTPNLGELSTHFMYIERFKDSKDEE